MKSTRVVFFTLFGVAAFCGTRAQTAFTPFATWNHAGISGVYLQPASIADTRLKFDMTFIGFDVNVGNSLYSVSYKDALKNTGDIDWGSIKTPLSGVKNRRFALGTEVQAFSFMASLAPKSAFGVSFRTRCMANIDGIDPNMFDIIQNAEAFVGNNKTYSIKNFGLRMNAWAEAGITYAREAFDFGEHYLKAGLTLKLLRPITSAHVFLKNAEYQIDKDPNGSGDDLIKMRASGEIAIPSGLANLSDVNVDMILNNIGSNKKLGFGFDFGAVYEYRPDHADYLSSDEGGKSKWNRYEPSKYLFRVGVSILDVGSMKYPADLTTSFDMNASSTMLLDKIENREELINLFGIQQKTTNYRMSLPAAISVQTDWRINRLFYLGVNPYFALRSKKGNSTHYMTSLNISPRLEMAALGVSLPITYDQFKVLNVGFGLNLGPLWIGSNNAFNMLAAKKLREVNFCMAMKISMYHKNRNK